MTYEDWELGWYLINKSCSTIKEKEGQPHNLCLWRIFICIVLHIQSFLNFSISQSLLFSWSCTLNLASFFQLTYFLSQESPTYSLLLENKSVLSFSLSQKFWILIINTLMEVFFDPDFQMKIVHLPRIQPLSLIFIP